MSDTQFAPENPVTGQPSTDPSGMITTLGAPAPSAGHPVPPAPAPATSVPPQAAPAPAPSPGALASPKPGIESYVITDTTGQTEDTAALPGTKVLDLAGTGVPLPKDQAGINTPVMQNVIGLLAKGRSVQDVHDYLAGKQAALLASGRTQQDVDNYFGFTLDARAATDAQIQAGTQQPKLPQQDPSGSALEAFERGAVDQSTMGIIGHTIAGQPPAKLPPQEVGTFNQIAQAVGTVAPSIPLISGTTAIGAEAGAAVGVWFAGIGAVPGAVIGAGLGAGVGWFTDAFVRNANKDAIINGGAKTPADLAGRVVNVVGQSLQDAAPNAVMGPAGEAVGAVTKGLAPVVRGALTVGGEVTAAAAAQIAVTGQLPTLESVATNAAQLIVLHSASGGMKWLTGRDAPTPAPGAKPEDAPITVGKITQNMEDLLTHHVITGELPEAANARLQWDYSWKGLNEKAASMGIPVSSEPIGTAGEVATTSVETLPQQLLMKAREEGGTFRVNNEPEANMLAKAGIKPNEDGSYDTRPLVQEADRRVAAGAWDNSMSQYDNSHLQPATLETEFNKPGGPADFGGATRARWFATAVTDGVPKANELLDKSGGNPALFNEYRRLDLQKDYQADPTKYGNDIKGYTEMFDSEPPAAPEARAKAVADARAIKPLPKVPAPVTSGFRGAVEDDFHALTTRALNVDNQLRANGAALPRVLSKPEADGTTPDEKFQAYHTNPDAAPLSPENKVLWDQHGQPMADLVASLEKKAAPYFGVTSSTELTGSQSAIPQFGTNKALNDLQRTPSNSFFANQAHRISVLTAIVRKGELLQGLVKDPRFLASATRADDPAVIPPKNYVKSTTLPGWLMDKDLANAIDDFSNGGPGAGIDKALAPLTALNNAEVVLAFSTVVGALNHAKNETTQYLIGRGWSNLNIIGTVKYGYAAIVDSIIGGAVQREILENGGALIASGIHQDDLYTFMQKRMGQSVASDERLDEIAKAFGLPNAAAMGKAIVLAQSKALYGYGDVLYKARYLELRDGGMTPKQAIKEVERFIPNYRLSSKVAGSRTIANLMGSKSIIQFGRYDLGRLRSIGNMFGGLLSPNSSLSQRWDASGQMAAAAVLLFVVKPQADKAVQWLTGNPNASFSMGGMLNEGEAAIQLGEQWNPANPDKNMQNLYSLIGKTFNPSMTTNELDQQRTGVDNFTNKPIAQGGLSQQTIERIWHFGGSTINPLPAFTNFPLWVEKSLGVASPSAAAQKYDATKGYTKLPNGHWVPSGMLQQSKDNPVESAIEKWAQGTLGF